MLTTAILFCGTLIFIFLIRSASPFGIELTGDKTNTIQTVKVKTANYQNGYTYNRNFLGLIEAKQNSVLGFEFGGRIINIGVNEGHIIKAGDVLAELDTARLNARVNEAKANLLKVKADEKLANSTYQRIHDARQKKSVSAQEKDEASEARDRTLAAVKVAEAQLESIIIDVDKSKLISPYNGTVIRRMVDEGTVVNAGQAVLEIQTNFDHDIRVGVSSEVAKNLAVSDQKKVKVNDLWYDATIKAILPTRSQTRTVDIILKLNKNDEMLRSGDVARLPIDYKIPGRGFWVPITALKEGRRGLWSLYIIDKNQGQLKTERRTVQVHYTNSVQAFVSGAIKNGEIIITQGAAKLVPGQEVRLMESDNES
jgi:RND family efflux transporter MFP subunit